MNFQEMTVKAEKAIIDLQKSEEEYARLRALKETEPERLKILLASLKLESPETSDNKAETWAKDREEYKQAHSDHVEILEDFYLVQAKRMTAETIVEVWRSLNAAHNRGNPI